VEGAQGNGLYVGNAGGAGVYVDNAAYSGVYVHNTGNHGLHVGYPYPAQHGLYVEGAAWDGVNVSGYGWAGYFYGDIYVSAGCTGCVLSEFGRNAGDRPLRPGDIVAVQGMVTSTLDTAPRLWQVVPAGAAGSAAHSADAPGLPSVVGVVRGRAELGVAPEGAALRDGETGQRLVPGDGVAQPGDYLTIVIYGPMQVRASTAGGPIQAGTRLAVGDDGLARPLRTVTVEGVTLAESAPLIGIALDAPDADGLVWVLVNPQ